MHPKTLFLIILALTILGCNTADEITPQNVAGDYTGVFQRGQNTSNVTLTLQGGNWSGESEFEKFPALCSGTYTLSDDNITFVNACIWTAEFDWSLILSGQWKCKWKDNSLVITYTNGDQYTLTKQ